MLVNTPWPSLRVDLAVRPTPDDTTPTTAAAAATATAGVPASDDSPAATVVVPVEMRWGVPVESLRLVWALHETCFPMSYNPAYYSTHTAPDSLVLIAYTTPAALAGLVARGGDGSTNANTNGNGGNANDDASGSDNHRDDDEEAGGSTTSTATVVRHAVPTTAATAAARQRGDYWLTAPAAMEEDARNRAATETLITELEYQAKRDADRAAGGGGGGGGDEDTMGDDTNTDNDSGNTNASDAFTAVLGFIGGQLAYARDGQCRFYTNPTGTVNNLCVAPPARGLGLGGRLLTEFLAYVTTGLPLRASHYLHYNEQDMQAMAWGLVRNDPSSTSNCGGGGGTVQGTVVDEKVEAADDAAAAEAGLVETALRFFFPEATTWVERRLLLRQLTTGAAAMTAAEADGEISRRVAAEVATASGRTADMAAEEAFFASLPADRRLELLDPVVQHGVREVWLECLADDGPLLTFYEGRGFAVARARLPDYYQFCGADHDGALLLYVPTPTASGSGGEAVPVGKGSTDAPLPSTTAAAACGCEDLAALVRRREEERERRRAVHAEATVKATVESGVAAAAGEAGAPTPSSSPTEAATTAGDDATPTTAAERRGVLSEWLSPTTYDDVTDVCVDSTENCRVHWSKLFHHRQGVARRRRLVTGDRPLTWMDTSREALLTANAVLCLSAVIYFAYYYGVR